MALRVRDATVADAGAVAALLAELGYPCPRELAAERLEHFEADVGSRIQLAEVDGDVAGLVATHVVPRLDGELRSCRIVDLVVAERRRRRGVGTALLRAGEAEARRRGCSRLDLSSGNWREDAHAFYERMGFESQARSFVKRLAG